MKNQIAENPLKYLHKQKATLIYFFSNHCAPCLSLRPKIKEMVKAKFPQMNLVFIDSEAQMEISAKYHVFTSPTILLYFDGKETKRYSKYISISELEQTIRRYYNMIFENNE